ncbi:MAG: VanZ family protein [Gemmatimonadota bacterium]|nr:VanZ family protein [Gemmatimonadota bacterium]
MTPVIFPAAHRPRRTTDRTGARLGTALLAYLTAVTLVVTLAPFAFTRDITHGLDLAVAPWEMAMNGLRLAPLGFLYQLSRPRGSQVRWGWVAWGAVGLGTLIETLQLLEPARQASPLDVASGTLGAALGAASFRLLSPSRESERTVRTLAVELPVMGLVYLLVPLGWLTGLASAGTARAWLVLPIGAAAALVLGTVHGAVLADRARRTMPWLWATCLVWWVVAIIPGAIRDLVLITTGALLMVFIAHIRASIASRYGEHHTTRRFERPTLVAIAPLVLLYLIGAAGWPWHDIGWPWPGVAGLLPAESLSTAQIFRPLEQLAAFTLVGYGLAEWDGRVVEDTGALAVRVAGRAGLLAVLLAVATAFLNGRPASVLLAVLSTAAAAVGGRLYTLQRDHVRALIRRSIRTMPAAAAATGNAAQSGPVGNGPVVSGPASRPTARPVSPFR